MLCALALLFGCSAERQPATQLVVVVDSDLRIDSQLRRVEVRVLDTQSSHELDAARFRLSGSAKGETSAELPFSFGVAQRGASRITLLLRGLGPLDGNDDALVVEHRSTVEFVSGQARLVRVFLAKACQGRSCPSGETCYPEATDDTPLGQCGPVLLHSTFAVRAGDEHNGAAARPSQMVDAGPTDGGSGGGSAAVGSGGEPAGGSAGKPTPTNDGSGGRAPATSPVAGQAGTAAGHGGSGPEQPDDDGGVVDAVAIVLHDYEEFRKAQKQGIDAVCSCFKELEYKHRMACEENWGLHQAGQAECVTHILEREASQVIQVYQCRRAVFESWRDCLALELDCSEQPDAVVVVKQCHELQMVGNERCAKAPDSVRLQLNVCFDLADAYWAYVDVVYDKAERVCLCYSQLGYDSLDACRQGEGIVYSEFAALEKCFFDVDGEKVSNSGQRASTTAYIACDQTRMTEYAACVDALSACDTSGAMRCKNIYRIDRAGCRTQAHLQRDPFELCGQ
jgi:hypothetical protein